MSVVTLVSGGLDSTLVAKLTQEEGITQYPLFIDYGQRSRDRELAACRQAMSNLGLPEPEIADVSGFGILIHSGLTDSKLDVAKDAFTPGRNMLFILMAASYAYQVDAKAISIGLLHENTSIFPDQTPAFLRSAGKVIECCMNRKIEILSPLSEFYKIDVLSLAKEKGIRDTYSCHMGDEEPCGVCIACEEFKFSEV